MKHERIMVAAALFGVSSALFTGCGEDVDAAGQGGDGNDTRATAQPLDIDTGIDGELSPASDIDFYSFQGKAGQFLTFFIESENPDLDTRITLFDADGKQIAENDDAIPSSTRHSQLFTRLPGDGTFFARVAECSTVTKTPTAGCAPPADPGATSYTMNIFELDPAYDFVTIDTEKGNDAASAQPVDYGERSDGGYFLSEVAGNFANTDDVDVFSLTMPEDIDVTDGARSAGYFWIMPGGQLGTGSTTGVGQAYITDAEHPEVVIAEVQPSVDGAMVLSPPLAQNKPYLLFVTHPQVPSGSSDFYVVRHGASEGNPVEIEDITNNDLTTAEPLMVNEDNNGQFHAFIEGDLSTAEMDVDHFKAVVPVKLGANGTVSIVCAAQFNGSGLRGLSISLFKGNGSSIEIDTDVSQEKSYRPARINWVALDGAKVIMFSVRALLPQAEDVTSTFYRCGLHFHS